MITPAGFAAKTMWPGGNNTAAQNHRTVNRGGRGDETAGQNHRTVSLEGPEEAHSREESPHSESARPE